MRGHRAPASRRGPQPELQPASARTLSRPPHRDPRAQPASGGKAEGWKSPKTDFPTPLGNPANRAGFPLSHRLPCGGWLNLKTEQFTCYELRTSSFAKNMQILSSTSHARLELY